MSLWFLPKYRGNLHQLQRLGRIELVGVLKTVKEVGYVCPTSLVSWCMLSCSIFSSHTHTLSANLKFPNSHLQPSMFPWV
jgi:hypothetical protein